MEQNLPSLEDMEVFFSDWRMSSVGFSHTKKRNFNWKNYDSSEWKSWRVPYKSSVSAHHFSVLRRFLTHQSLKETRLRRWSTRQSSAKSLKKITSPDKNVKRRSNDLEGGKEQTLGYVKKVIGGTRRSASRWGFEASVYSFRLTLLIRRRYLQIIFCRSKNFV
jgi:hypothetical protein